MSLLLKQSVVPMMVDETLKDQLAAASDALSSDCQAQCSESVRLEGELAIGQSPTCDVCEVVLGAHVPHRIDAAIGRLQVVVHLHRGPCILALMTRPPSSTLLADPADKQHGELAKVTLMRCAEILGCHIAK